ncbi:MAG TPA: PAS domain-containing protein [Stellaceae bacterium]|nr:PAS domain-containing protein [Stellaceae bacterium]
MHAPIREKRLTMRALGHWRDAQGERPFPCLTDIDPARLGDDWDYCLLLRLATPLERSRFLHVGRRLCVPTGSPFEGRCLKDCPQQTVLAQATSYVSAVINRRVPVSLGGTTLNAGVPVLYRSILTPLSDDGTTIDAIFGAANYRIAPASDEGVPP